MAENTFISLCVRAALQVWVLTNLFSHFRDGLRFYRAFLVVGKQHHKIQRISVALCPTFLIFCSALLSIIKFARIPLFAKVGSCLRSLAGKNLAPLARVRAC